jgi:hypothetical protein
MTQESNAPRTDESTIQSGKLQTMAFSRLFILVLLCIAAMPTNADATHALALDFALNPTQPSAQGMSFYTDSGRPESDLVSIVGGNRLTLDSYAASGDRQVYYYAEIQHLKYSNQPFSIGGEVPESLSLAIWLLLAGGFVSCTRGRNPWQGARAAWLSARSLRVSALLIPMLILTLSLTGCGDGRTGSSSKSSSQNSVPASKGPAGSQNQDSDKSYPVAEGPIE